MTEFAQKLSPRITLTTAMPAFQLKRPHHPQVIAQSLSVQLSLASSEPSKRAQLLQALLTRLAGQAKG